MTLRVRRGVPNLRTQVCLAALERAFAGGRERFGMRLVHFSVQGNHLHLVVEVESAEALSRGMRGLGIRIARRLNAAVGRRGAVFAERYHAQPMGSPRQVRNGLRYVLLNGMLHAAGVQQTGRSAHGPVRLDPCSSASCFDGWRPDVPLIARAAWGAVGELVVPAQTWLLRVGWRRWGAIDPCV